MMLLVMLLMLLRANLLVRLHRHALMSHHVVLHHGLGHRDDGSWHLVLVFGGLLARTRHADEKRNNGYNCTVGSLCGEQMAIVVA